VNAIVYLHGFRSSSRSVKATRLCAAVAALDEGTRPLLHVPDLPHRPASAMASVAAWVEGYGAPPAVTFIGSSLGGYYATWLAERYGAKAVVINPAIRPAEDLRPFIGPQRNLHTGIGYDLTVAHFFELEALEVARITRPERYFLLVRTGDEVLDWRAAAAFYAGAFQYVAGGGNHGWEDFDAEVASVLRFCGCALPHAGGQNRLRSGSPA